MLHRRKEKKILFHTPKIFPSGLARNVEEKDFFGLLGSLRGERKSVGLKVFTYRD